MITQQRLKELLDYEPTTGIFRWRVHAGCRKAGDITGCINSSGYLTIKLDGRHYQAHRLAFIWMTGEVPDFVDHKDKDKTNNRWTNLRPATRQENMFNRSKFKSNKSGFKGVSFYAKTKRWKAQIQKGGVKIHLGYYATAEQASEVYQRNAIELFGDFSA